MSNVGVTRTALLKCLSEVFQLGPVVLLELVPLRQRHHETDGEEQNTDGGHIGIGSGGVTLVPNATFATNLQCKNDVSVECTLSN